MDQKPKVVGIYRIAMKEGSENYRESAVIDIIKALKARKTNIIIYEPTIKSNKFLGCKVSRSLHDFKDKADIIVANRNNPELMDVADKLFTRDLFGV